MLEKLRQQYFQTVLVTMTDEELYDVLPNRNYSNFSEIMQGIIKLLVKEIKSNMSLLSKEKDEEMILLYKEEIFLLQRKLSICENMLRSSYIIDEPEDKKIDETKKNIIIFGVSPVGNVSFLSDLRRDVDEHYYPAVLELLNSMRDGTAANNPDTIKRFTGANTKLQGIYEAKTYQIRIIFQPIEDVIYVDMVRVKKDDSSLKDRNEPIKRLNLLTKDFERVRRIVKSGQGLEELIIQNEEVYQDIINFVETKTKKDGKNNA
jgi:hypothetical protein